MKLLRSCDKEHSRYSTNTFLMTESRGDFVLRLIPFSGARMSIPSGESCVFKGTVTAWFWLLTHHAHQGPPVGLQESPYIDGEVFHHLSQRVKITSKVELEIPST